MGVNILGYLRVSGKGQVQKEDSDDKKTGEARQADNIGAFCIKHDLVSLGNFFEPGVSGTTECFDRPAFRDMMAKIDLVNEQGNPGFRIDAIVVERMDRIARDLMVSEFFLKELRSRKVQVFCTDQAELIDMATNEGDPTRKLIRQFLGALAEWNKSILVGNLKAGRNRYRVEGLRCEGVKPYGFYPGEMEVLVEIQEMRELGMSYEKIARGLNSRNSKTRNGKLWNQANVFAMFSHRRCKQKVRQTCVELISNTSKHTESRTAEIQTQLNKLSPDEKRKPSCGSQESPTKQNPVTKTEAVAAASAA